MTLIFQPRAVGVSTIPENRGGCWGFIGPIPLPLWMSGDDLSLYAHCAVFDQEVQDVNWSSVQYILCGNRDSLERAMNPNTLSARSFRQVQAGNLDHPYSSSVRLLLVRGRARMSHPERAECAWFCGRRCLRHRHNGWTRMGVPDELHRSLVGRRLLCVGCVWQIAGPGSAR